MTCKLILLHQLSGGLPDISEATHGVLDVGETDRPTSEATRWSGRIVQQRETCIELEIHIPVDCAIGEWSVCVDTRTSLENRKTNIFRYEHPDSIYILFNPWCKGNALCPSTPLRKGEILFYLIQM